ncbi:hypothetical protein SYNPS1DRAFT_29553 [Syncephalis pseudoplumigaleata]|uniref:Uncharacterized protein n=1 Tax=Syncephalis pseudoplumigaleata TaxID=1712513 RepID=A0A4P9Z040_9FUNG|nr:hypothetical protein SYNPS1DRAFT_29553 [Syncephalis pseudoplumigaleata]|eukprot:RKP24690.1 hypothetical protein SYNPS1DRAFT_29553 [Syncephalis pseudoplumigaleata]
MPLAAHVQQDGQQTSRQCGGSKAKDLAKSCFTLLASRAISTSIGKAPCVVACANGHVGPTVAAIVALACAVPLGHCYDQPHRSLFCATLARQHSCWSSPANKLEPPSLWLGGLIDKEADRQADRQSGTLTNHVIPNYWSQQPPAGLPIVFAFVALGDLFWAIAAKDCQFQHRPFSPDNICLFFARNSWLIPRRHLSTAPYHSRIFYVSRHGFPSSLRLLDFFVFVSCVFVCSCVYSRSTIGVD